MDIPIYYFSLPHDISGSRSKNRFRAELLWGVSKMLDLMETDREFTMVFDYACDIEIHYQDSLEFYQIKTRKNCKPYTTKLLKEIKGEGSILGKIYVLCNKSNADEVRVAIVSNAPYNAFSTDHLMTCFTDLPEKDKREITESLKAELGVPNVDFSKIFYIQSNMDLEHPDDAVRGKLTLAFERIKKCEPTNPNALYRLIVDTVSEKACYEYTAKDYEEITRLKGLSRRQFDDLLSLHDERSKTGIKAANEYIDRIPNLNVRKMYKCALPNAFKLLATSHHIKKLESDVSIFLEENNVGDTDQAIELLTNTFDDYFPIEVSRIEKRIMYIVFINRYVDGVYEYENDI